MKKLLLIFTNTIRRSRVVLLIAFAGGFALCILFNMIANLDESYYGSIPIGFYAHEETPVTEDFRLYLTDELGMEVTESNDIEYLNTELVERHIAAVVEVPEGFETSVLNGEPIPLLVSFLDDYANAVFVQGYLESYAASVCTLALGANGDSAVLAEMLSRVREDIAPIKTEYAQSDSVETINQQNAFRQVLGFYMMFSFLLAFAMAIQLFDDRQNGLYRRIKASSVHTVQYISGICMVGALCSAALIAPFFVYVYIAKFAIGVELWQTIVIAFLYALFVEGIALVCGIYLATKNAITAAIVGGATIMCMLGGAFFPITTSPVFLQNLARITPQFWFIDAVENLQQNTGDSFGLNALIVGLFALLCYVLAGIKFVDSQRKHRTS